MQTSRLLSYSSKSPSFDSFSSAVDLAAIAARVIDELRDHEQRPDDDNSDFAFDCPSRECSHPIAIADEIFHDGKILPSNPYGGGTEKAPPRRHRPALRKLMSEERGPEDLICVSPESYCVWTPKGGGDELSSSPPSQRKIKSSSAGFSKRWKLRSLLYREEDGETNSDHHRR